MSLWVRHSAFWDWQVVDFGAPSLKYSYTLHGKFGVSKLVIIIDSCVVIKLWFTFANQQSVSQTAKAKQIVFCIIFLYYILYWNEQIRDTYLYTEATEHIYIQAE